ncbi:MAG: hypothetical protein WC700_09910 [Gemmatimonadaceae bacterium]|jgi:hypothetical protein
MLTAVAIAAGWMMLGALAVIIVGQLLSGEINLHGLLHVKQRDGAHGVPEISAVRVQLLLATLVTASAWLTGVWTTRASGTLPDIDTRWLYGLGASQAVYLGRKAMQFFPMLTEQRQP